MNGSNAGVTPRRLGFESCMKLKATLYLKTFQLFTVSKHTLVTKIPHRVLFFVLFFVTGVLQNVTSVASNL